MRFVVDDGNGRIYLEEALEKRKRIRLGRILLPENVERLVERGILGCLK